MGESASRDDQLLGNSNKTVENGNLYVATDKLRPEIGGIRRAYKMAVGVLARNPSSDTTEPLPIAADAVIEKKLPNGNSVPPCRQHWDNLRVRLH